MKKILLSMAVLLALANSTPSSAQRHRHTPRTEQVASQSKPTNNADEGIEAFSDTSSVAADTIESAYAAAPNDSVDDSNRFSPGRFSDPFSWFGYVFSSSVWGGLFTILFILLVLAFLFMPLIIVLLIIRYFVNKHNDRVRLAEKAMEQGQPLTDEQMPLSKKSPDYMWRRGVRNVSLGVGLMLFFWFLGADPLVGIGGLVACLGVGQMFMVRYNYNSSFGRKKKDDDEDNFNGFGTDISDLKFGDEDDKKE